jgi:hypothetical protein
MSGCGRRPHKLLKTCRNDTKCNMKQLLDLIYTGVGLGAMDSLSPVPTLLISAILCLRVSFSLADIFAYACLTSLCLRGQAMSHTIVDLIKEEHARHCRPGKVKSPLHHGLGIANARCCVHIRGSKQEKGTTLHTSSAALASVVFAHLGSLYSSTPLGGLQPQCLKRPPPRAKPLNHLVECTLCPPALPATSSHLVSRGAKSDVLRSYDTSTYSMANFRSPAFIPVRQ